MKWNEEDVKEALKEIKSGKLIRPTAANYGMSEGMLRNRIKMEEKGKALVGSGAVVKNMFVSSFRPVEIFL